MKIEGGVDLSILYGRTGDRFGLRTSFRKANRSEGKPNRSPNLLRLVQTEPILGVNRRCFFFSRTSQVSTRGAQGGESAGEEEMEDHEEIEEAPTSTYQYSRLTVLSFRTRQTLGYST